MKNHINTSFLNISIVVFTLFSCKETKNENITTEDIKFTKEADLSIFSLKDTIVLSIKKLDIEIAENDYERETGLMYRKSMEERQGMLFIFDQNQPQSFYMKNTLIPLDLVFISDQHKIVSFQTNAEPLNENSLSSDAPAKYVLEINAGLSDRWNLRIGDSIAYQKIK